MRSLVKNLLLLDVRNGRPEQLDSRSGLGASEIRARHGHSHRNCSITCASSLPFGPFYAAVKESLNAQGDPLTLRGGNTKPFLNQIRIILDKQILL